VDITKKYFVNFEEVESSPGCWNTLMVHVHMRNEDGTTWEIGKYPRNYPSAASSTFCPFRQGDREYALYSTDYTATRVMELPACKDVAGEEPDSVGFCPVEYYVPGMSDDDWNDGGELNGRLGFVAGCVWGDDTSWKIQVLDLSHIAEGKFYRDDRIGYVELPNMPLKDAIRLIFANEEGNGFVRMQVATQKCFDINLNDQAAEEFYDLEGVCKFLRDLHEAGKKQVEPNLVFQFLYGLCNAHCSIASDLCKEFYERFRVMGLIEKGYIMRTLFEWLSSEFAEKMVKHYFELDRLGREQDERARARQN
jgi:hypothetical protein